MPDPNITNFISQFSGGARPNRYEVLLTFPGGVPNEMEKLSFTCKATSLPASIIGKVDVPYMSRQIAVAGDRTVDDWNITVINDVDFKVRRSFETWMNKINMHEGNKSDGGWNDPKRYYADAEITQFDREHNEIKKIKMRAIFPTNMSDITLGWGDNDTVEEFQVTFAVNWWETDTTS